MYKDLNDASTCMTGNKRGNERTESYNMYKEKKNTEEDRGTINREKEKRRLADRQLGL